MKTAIGAGALNTCLMKASSGGDARKSWLSFSVFLCSFYCSLNGLWFVSVSFQLAETMVLLQAASQERDARGDVASSLVSNVSYFVVICIAFPQKSLAWLRFLYFVCQEL